ncbi:hypothetical protein [Bdellovibrio reynosensis]|uniref:DUF19 domain-containing protein n=1 Tax=Bdellovibrio reynosensis TaxID=2835041 RepID=A0ABY4CBA3_9BACT|nr:hypothetical protein [Bdellovibrio reynosensis]UOF00793.1 hypothetical protein MNR06_13910 [Bdellovibrio reynosensis]
MKKLIFAASILVTHFAFAGELIQGGSKKLSLTNDELKGAQKILEARCNDMNVVNRLSMGAKECIAKVSADHYSKVAAQNCSAGSDFFFFECLAASKGLDIPQEVYDFCKPMKDGDKKWSPKANCLNHLATTNFKYNKKSLSDCYKYINLSENNIAFCQNILRDRDVSDKFVTDCLIKNGNISSSNVTEKTLNCMAKEAESAKSIACAPSSTAASEIRASNGPNSRTGVR